MTLVKAVGPDGNARSASFCKIDGPDGVKRTVSFIKIVGADGVLRTAYAAGGTPPAGENPASINPAYKSLSGYGTSRSYVFTASAASGSPSAYAWGVLSGEGYVSSGAASASATLTVSGYATFFCDVTIAGVVYRATCDFEFTNIGNAGGGNGGPLQ